MSTVVQIDLDAIEQAALSAPLKGPFWAVTDSYDTTVYTKVENGTSRGTEGVLASGTESYVNDDMLPFFTAVSPAVVLVLIALARRGVEALQAEDRVAFNLPVVEEDETPTAVLLGSDFCGQVNCPHCGKVNSDLAEDAGNISLRHVFSCLRCGGDFTVVLPVSDLLEAEPH